MMKKNTLEYLYSLKPIHGTDRKDKNEYIKHVISVANSSLDMAEFGIGHCGSAKMILRYMNSKQTLYLFDSFEGIPEEWNYETNCIRPKGYGIYERGKVLKELEPHAGWKIVEGLYSYTVPRWAYKYRKQLGFIHIDCDLYSSARDVLDNLWPCIRTGTIIAFDEYANYGGFHEHEYKAFYEFCQKYEIEFEYVARMDTQVAVRIL